MPPGEWRDAWTGEVLRGGRVIERDVPVDVIPVYAREAAMSGSQLDLPFEMS